MQLFSRLLFVACLLSAAASAVAQGRLSDDETSRFHTVPHDPEMQAAVEESDLDLLVVQHEGWQETLPTFARLKIHEITGRKTIRGQNPSYAILSMIYNPEAWQDARILPVEHPELLEIMGLDGKWVSANMVRGSDGLNKLIQWLEDASERRNELDRVRKLVNAVEQVHRLGREDRVLSQFELDERNPITQAELEGLLDAPKEVRALHEQRRKLEKQVEEQKPLRRAGERLLTHTMALAQVRQDFLIVPGMEAENEQWIRPASMERGSFGLERAARQFDLSMQQAFLANRPDIVVPAAEQFLSLLERSRLYPPERYREAQNFYIRLNPYGKAAWVYLFAACLYGLYFFFRGRSWYWASFAAAGAGFGVHTLAVALRFYLKGHIPVSNMFEAITFTSWAVILIALVMEAIQRKGLVGLGSTIVAFLLLTGAGLMPLHETRLHPLRAVLNSYWLNIHVTMMLVSYAAFAISAVFALVYIVRTLSARQALLAGLGGGGGGLLLLGGYQLIRWAEMFLRSSSGLLNMLVNAVEIGLLLAGALLVLAAIIAGGGYLIRAGFLKAGLLRGDPPMTLQQNEEFAYRLVQVGWPILTLGVTLGAVWADTAWGRFWGWDPKETWAFITWVAYTVYLHSRMVMGWRGRWSAAACLIGFIMVLITWLGVSYLPWFSGGLHSYASPT